MNKTEIAAYKDAIIRERLNIGAQSAWLARLGIDSRVALKRAVQSYFEQIKCSFNEELYNHLITQ